MESVYNKRVDLSQLLLYKKDFIKLIEIICESPTNESISLELTISNKDLDIKIGSIEELRSYEQEGCFSNITVKIYFDNNVNNTTPHYISMDFTNLYARYYINSNDQIWFLGKINQLNNYLQPEFKL